MPKQYSEEQKKLAGKLQESLSRSEFEELALTIAKKVKSIEAKNINDLRMIADAISKLAQKTKEDNGNNFGSLKSEVNEIVKNSLSSMTSEINNKLASVRDGIDGINADEDIIVDKVLNKVVLPEMPNITKDIPKLGEPIRDSLELLQGKERIKLESILGLRAYINKKIKDYDRKVTPLAGVATFNPDSFNTHVINNQVPTGSVNGVNKEFTLSLAPSPATSLKFYWNGQLLLAGSDYALSGKVITMEIAPDTGDNIWADFMV